MHFALFGTNHVYRLAGAGGRNAVTPDGLNRWMPGGRHQRYLVLTDAVRLTAAIDELINTVPAGR
jgi:hypothetical protein